MVAVNKISKISQGPKLQILFLYIKKNTENLHNYVRIYFKGFNLLVVSIRWVEKFPVMMMYGSTIAQTEHK